MKTTNKLKGNLNHHNNLKEEEDLSTSYINAHRMAKTQLLSMSTADYCKYRFIADKFVEVEIYLTAYVDNNFFNFLSVLYGLSLIISIS